MLTFTRDTKRLTIVVVYLLILLVLGAGIFMAVRPDPTCFDGVQNQNEQGVDCGGICTNVCVERIVGNDLLVREIAFVAADRGKYDIVARIFNPNNDIGASRFQYSLSLRDASGRELAREQRESFILPQETKALLAFNLEPGETPAKAVIELSDFQWSRLRDFRANPELNVYDKRYVERPDPSVFGAVTGKIVNESLYDFRMIQIKAILRDATGTPLAVNQSDMRTVMVGREQDIRLVFPQPFAGTVDRIDIEVEANVYDGENFLKQYNAPEAVPPQDRESVRPVL